MGDEVDECVSEASCCSEKKEETTERRIISKSQYIGKILCSKGYVAEITLENGKLKIGRCKKPIGMFDKIFRVSTTYYRGQDAVGEDICTRADGNIRLCDGACLDSMDIGSTRGRAYQTCDYLKGISLSNGAQNTASGRSIFIPYCALK